jgi:hypothetical protein
MRSLKYLFIAGAISVFGAAEAFAEANCWCKVSINNLTNQKHASGVIKDYGSLGTYKGINQQSDTNQTDCNTKCTYKAAPDDGSAALASAACSAGAGNGVDVIAFSAVGTKEYKSAEHLGKIKRSAAQYSCPQGGNLSGSNCVISVGAETKCPKDYWLENHKKPFQCVKQACAQGSMPGVPAWLAIGGAVNGGRYLTDDKGGSRFFVNASLSCASGFTLNGENCVKSYPATVVKPASCGF